MVETPAEIAVFGILAEFVEDWGLDDIELTRGTLLVADLGFESTDTMQLFLAIQETFPGATISFQELVMKDGGFVKDLKIGEITQFVNASLAKSMAGESA